MAMGLIWAYVGFEFGSSDDYSFLPWVYQLDDPGLYANDARFSVGPSGYYHLHIALLYWAAKLLPLPYVFIVLNALSVVMLLYAMQRLARTLWNTVVPVSGIAFLMAAYGNGHLVAGYYLLSRGFSTHYPAIALALLALSFALERKRAFAASSSLAGIVINPRMGLIAGLLALAATLAQTWRNGARRIRLLLFAALAGLAGLIAVLYLQIGNASPRLDEIVRFWVYVRSPGHYLPSYWSGYVLPNLAMTLILAWCVRSLDKNSEAVRTTYWIWVGTLLAILVGITNNQLFISAPLVLANPLQFGPIALALVYVFLMGVLVRALEQQLILPALIVLAMPTTQLRLAALIVLLIAREGEEKFESAGGARAARWKRLPVALVQLAVIGIAITVIPSDMRQISLIESAKDLLLNLCALGMGVLVARATNRSTHVAIVAAATLALVAAPLTGRVHGIRINPGATNEWQDVCSYVERNTEREAIFVIPPEKFDFQGRTRRSAFVSFVHIPLQIKDIPEWIRRLGLIGVYPQDMDIGSLSRSHPPDMTRYEILSPSELKTVAAAHDGPAYVIRRTRLDGATPIFTNGKYFLYRL